MIVATILFCLADAPGNCPVQKQVRVERGACAIAPIRAQLPHDGRWRDVVVRVMCRGH